MPTPMQYAALAKALNAKGWADWLPAVREWSSPTDNGTAVCVDANGTLKDQILVVCASKADFAVLCRMRQHAPGAHEFNPRCATCQLFPNWVESVLYAVRHARNYHNRQPWIHRTQHRETATAPARNPS